MHQPSEGWRKRISDSCGNLNKKNKVIAIGLFPFFQFFAVIFFPNIKGWQTSIRSTRVLIQSSEGCYNNGYDTIFGKHGQNFIKWHLHCTKVFIITMHTIHQECSFICLRRIACSVFFKTELDPIYRYRYAPVFRFLVFRVLEGLHNHLALVSISIIW